MRSTGSSGHAWEKRRCSASCQVAAASDRHAHSEQYTIQNVPNLLTVIIGTPNSISPRGDCQEWERRRAIDPVETPLASGASGAAVGGPRFFWLAVASTFDIIAAVGEEESTLAKITGGSPNGGIHG